MKKIVILLLSIIGIFGLASCASVEDTTSLYEIDSINAAPVNYIEDSLEKNLSSSKGTMITISSKETNETATDVAKIYISVDNFSEFLDDGFLSHIKLQLVDQSNTNNFMYFDGSTFFVADGEESFKLNGMSEVTFKYLMESKLDFLIPALDADMFTVSSVSNTEVKFTAREDIKEDLSMESVEVKYTSTGLTGIYITSTSEIEGETNQMSMEFSEFEFPTVDTTTLTFEEKEMPYDMDPQLAVDFLVLAKRLSMTDFTDGFKGSIDFSLMKNMFEFDSTGYYESSLDFNFFLDQDKFDNAVTTTNDDGTKEYSEYYDSVRFSFDLTINKDMANAIVNLLGDSYPMMMIGDTEINDITVKVYYLGDGNILVALLNGEECIYKESFAIDTLLADFDFDGMDSMIPFASPDPSTKTVRSVANYDESLFDFTKILGSLRSEVTDDYVRFYLSDEGITSINTLLSISSPSTISIPEISNIETKMMFDNTGSFSGSLFKVDSQEFNLLNIEMKIEEDSSLDDFSSFLEEFNSYTLPVIED